jgi:CRISPR/Cas system type I-B associated protein Csh2 (Cas7 group RAMP superfamily)
MRMKMKNWIGVVMAVSVFVFAAGCGKSDATTDRNKAGVQVDMPKLMETCQTVTKPEIQASLNQASYALYHGQYETASSELEKLSTAPELNDKQKKLAKEVSEQVKQLAAKASGR